MARELQWALNIKKRNDDNNNNIVGITHCKIKLLHG